MLSQICSCNSNCKYSRLPNKCAAEVHVNVKALGWIKLENKSCRIEKKCVNQVSRTTM